MVKSSRADHSAAGVGQVVSAEVAKSSRPDNSAAGVSDVDLCSAEVAKSCWSRSSSPYLHTIAVGNPDIPQMPLIIATTSTSNHVALLIQLSSW